MVLDHMIPRVPAEWLRKPRIGGKQIDRCVHLLSRITVLFYQCAEKTNFMSKINNYI
jgi:hypothetical protein